MATRRMFPDAPARAFEPPAAPVGLWRSEAFEPVTLAGTGTERLRRFHAHYGEEVLGRAREGDTAGTRAAMEAWLGANPPRPGDAWHPYTTSTRAGNWIAALALAPDAATSEITASLRRQLRHLALNVEDDVLGNHVIRNARALVLGGVAFADGALLDRGRALLERELPEQILPDGGHYERSPVYHLIVLRDLLEIEAAAPGLVAPSTLEAMRRFAAALARPDGEPALFNDGTLDLAPALELPPPQEGLSLFPETGYAVIRRGPLWLAFDCGPFAPDFLPAHAHADALSFQLWWDGEPVVIDPGMPTYEPGPERDWFRGTAAHSTASIDGRDQFELWGAFRSGPFPPVGLVDAGEDRLEATVAWGRGRLHVRRVELSGSEVTVLDHLDLPVESGVASTLPLGSRSAEVTSLGGLPRAEERRAPRAERLFRRSEGPTLVREGRLARPAETGWRLRLAGGRPLSPV